MCTVFVETECSAFFTERVVVLPPRTKKQRGALRKIQLRGGLEEASDSLSTVADRAARSSLNDRTANPFDAVESVPLELLLGTTWGREPQGTPDRGHCKDSY